MDYCLNCGKDAPAGRSFCDSCEDQIAAIRRAAEAEAIRPAKIHRGSITMPRNSAEAYRMAGMKRTKYGWE